VTSTVCTPSRYTCLTGRYAGSSCFPAYLEECPLGRQGLPAFNVGLERDNMNVGHLLARSGYATGYVGKYHVGGKDAEAQGLHHVPKNAEYSDELNRKQYENEKRYRQLIMERGFTWAKNIYWENLKEPFRGHNPEWTVAAALEFIRQNRSRPFYLHYCTTLLHGPNGEWFKSLDKPKVTGEGMIDSELHVMPPRETVMRRIRRAGLTENEAGYLWMDDSLGMILDKLDELGIAQNTIVVFLADHGSVRKGSLYSQYGTEVPCIIRWPAGIEQNSQCHELIQNTDFVPTWFELAGVELARVELARVELARVELAGVERPRQYKMDGVSLAPLFRNPEKPVRDYVYNEIGAARSIKTKQWTYISLRFTKDQVDDARARPRTMKRLLGLSGGIARGHDNPSSFEYDQLYHVGNDPGETNNLAQNPEYKGKLQEMKGLLTTQLQRFGDRPYGEFVPGGNALPIGSFDDVLEAARAEAGKRK
jgi:arylsulfatase A-like enzyme